LKMYMMFRLAGWNKQKSKLVLGSQINVLVDMIL
jgi:hypothetical protein